MFEKLTSVSDFLMCMESHFKYLTLLSLAQISFLKTTCILAFDLGKEDFLPVIRHRWQPEGILQGMNILSLMTRSYCSF